MVFERIEEIFNSCFDDYKRPSSDVANKFINTTVSEIYFLIHEHSELFCDNIDINSEIVLNAIAKLAREKYYREFF